MIEIDSERYASAGCWLPFDIVFDDFAIEPFGRSAAEQGTVTSREEGEKFAIARTAGLVVSVPRDGRQILGPRTGRFPA